MEIENLQVSPDLVVLHPDNMQQFLEFPVREFHSLFIKSETGEYKHLYVGVPMSGTRGRSAANVIPFRGLEYDLFRYRLTREGSTLYVYGEGDHEELSIFVEDVLERDYIILVSDGSLVV